MGSSQALRRLCDDARRWCRSATLDLLDITLDRRCACCGRPHPSVCPDCRAAWRSPFALPAALPGLRVVAAATYRDAGPAVIAFKERGRWTLEAVLADALARSVHHLLADRPREPVTLVPVPTWPAKVRSRGLDHTRALADRAACALAPTRAVDVRPLVSHVRAVADQSTLDEVGRAANLGGALAARPVVGHAAPLRVVVVDDVLTTGATARETVRALALAGWPVAGVAVVAAAITPAAPGRRGPVDRV